jgi:hypothetical protein
VVILLFGEDASAFAITIDLAGLQRAHAGT